MVCIFLQEILDELASLFTDCSKRQLPGPLAAAKEKVRVHFTPPVPSLAPPQPIVTCESPFMLAASGETGLRTWEAALHLGHFFYKEYGQSDTRKNGQNGMDGMNVLELGAGTGFLSILCARYFRACHVLATDGSDEIINGIRSNLHLNELSESPAFKTAVLQWGHTLTDDLFQFDDELEKIAFDLVIGADLVGTCLHFCLTYPSACPASFMYRWNLPCNWQQQSFSVPLFHYVSVHAHPLINPKRRVWHVPSLELANVQHEN